MGFFSNKSNKPRRIKEGETHPFFPETGVPPVIADRFLSLTYIETYFVPGKTIILSNSGIVGKVVEVCIEKRFAKLEIAPNVIITVDIYLSESTDGYTDRSTMFW